jgi:hypothetical protein
MIFETIVLAVIAGYIFKGDIRRIADSSPDGAAPIRGLFFIFGALIVRNIPVIFKLGILKQFSYMMEFAAPNMFLFSYLMMAIGLFFNIRHRPIIIMFFGTVLNFIVIFANYGFMPVSRQLLVRGDFDFSTVVDGRLDMNHIVSTSQTKLMLLGDIILISRPYPFPQLLSIGDIFMCVGLFVYIFTEMTSRPANIVRKVRIPEVTQV